ncbi:MAG: diaminopimelate epimerase [Actinomycetota bacterium]
MTDELSFSKYQGTGNDFVMVEDLLDEIRIHEDDAALLCDRRFGVGADGTIRVTGVDAKAAKETAKHVGVDPKRAQFFMDHRNADGTTSEMCGNGIRCLAAFVHDRGLEGGDEIDVLTRSGIKQLRLRESDDGLQVRVAMGPARFPRATIPMRGPAWEPFLGEPFELGDGLTLKASALSMGNPHLVLFVEDDPARYHVAHIGPAIEHHELFPERTNVEFVAIQDGDLKVRVWERGVGETMACGTGAAAALVAANEAGLCGPRAVVRFPGGAVTVERLEDGEVTLTGPAMHVYDGIVNPARLLPPS